jgi:hypothetical protein
MPAAELTLLLLWRLPDPRAPNPAPAAAFAVCMLSAFACCWNCVRVCCCADVSRLGPCLAAPPTLRVTPAEGLIDCSTGGCVRLACST